jgi:hypothetical protein
MRRVIVTILPVVAVTVLTTPSLAAPARPTELFCAFYKGCIRTTSEAYNACFHLALQRGWNITRTDNRGRNAFIFDCLTGKIPR